LCLKTRDCDEGKQASKQSSKQTNVCLMGLLVQVREVI